MTLDTSHRRLRAGANRAGLKGAVIPVWQDGDGHRFVAPSQWHPFFKHFGWADILANINRELTIGQIMAIELLM